MKVVHVSVKLETPDDARDVADTLRAILAHGLKALRPDWKVKKAQ